MRGRWIMKLRVKGSSWERDRFRSIIKAPPSPVRMRIEQAVQREIDALIDDAVKDILHSTRTYTGDDLLDDVDRICRTLTDKFRGKYEREVVKYYLREKSRIAQQLKTKLDFRAHDLEALRELTRSEIMWRAYRGLGNVLSEKVNGRIKSFFEHGDYERLVKEIRADAGIGYSRSERIARTETGVISNLAKANAFDEYDPEGMKRYMWYGPDDVRNTDWCRLIRKLTRQGVSLGQLRDIIRVHGDTRLKNRRDYQVHINCRHTFVPI